GPPRNDDLSAHVERAHERLVAHLRDDTHAAIDLLVGQRRLEVKGGRAAARDLALQPALVHLGADYRGAEVMAALAADLAIDLERPLEVRGAASAARRADEDGHAPLPGSVEAHAEVALERAPVGERHARAQVVR